MKTLVIGYGNTLRGDDGVGPVVADRFRAEAEARLGAAAAAVEIVTAPQLMPEHADDMAHAGRVVFVDASVDEAPGAVAHRAGARIEWDPAAAGHGYDPATLAALARAVSGASPEVHVVTVGAACFDYFCETLSPEVTAAIPTVLDLLADIVTGRVPVPADAA